MRIPRLLAHARCIGFAKRGAKMYFHFVVGFHEDFSEELSFGAAGALMGPRMAALHVGPAGPLVLAPLLALGCCLVGALNFSSHDCL